MNNIIKVTTEEGNQIEVEVLDIFGVAGYEDKEYIMYTQNKEVDEDNIKVFISILHKENDQYQLLGIADEQEWATVQKAINEMDEDENE